MSDSERNAAPGPEDFDAELQAFADYIDTLGLSSEQRTTVKQTVGQLLARHARRVRGQSPEGPAPSTGAELIAAERRRQVEEEGWTPEHDDTHINGELAISAAAYAWPPDIVCRGVHRDELWPWGSCDWKPGDRIRELAKAGALITAEIDRLQREEGSDG